MTDGLRKAAWERAETDRQLCVEWLKPYVASPQPKLWTKAQLREAAITQLGISKTAFDHAWIMVIEETGRQDWYEPLRRRQKPPS